MRQLKESQAVLTDMEEHVQMLHLVVSHGVDDGWSYMSSCTKCSCIGDSMQ